MTTGTNHFIHLQAACNYYAVYGLTKAEVQQKVKDGEICLSPPELKAGEKSAIHPTEKRYFIES